MAEVQPSLVPAVALSSSWFCAGATESPDSVAGGELLFENAGPQAVAGTVDLVTQTGYEASLPVSVPAGSTTTMDEGLPGLAGSNSDHWVGAMVTLYGGTASVSQVVTTSRGSASQPCASAAAPRWYFADGATLRNASDEISLLNPYPFAAVVDLSFTTDEGLEQPLAYEGVVVGPHGLTVLNLGSHLRRRQHIAVTVTARTGDIVAFETEIVTPPPAGAPPVGAPGAVNPVVPVAGITLTLGSTRTSTSLWWPDGGEGPGLTESYAVYNPGPRTARLSLSLISGQSGVGVGSSSPLTVGAYGSVFVTTNNQPWALPGIAYVVHLDSTNGTAVVAERLSIASPPAPERGLAALLGQTQAADEWLVTGGLAAASSFSPAQFFLGQVYLSVVDPGRRPAQVTVETLSHQKLVPASVADQFEVAGGEHIVVPLPSSLAGEAVVVTSSRPILLEQDWYSPLPSVGTNLAPAAAVVSSP